MPYHAMNNNDNFSATHAPHISVRKGILALSPALLFLLLYVAVSLAIGDFYVMPVTVAFLASSIWAVAIYRGKSLTERIEIFSRAAANTDILYMVWIFVLAGAFAALAKGIGAIDATVSLTLQIFPPQFILPAIFFAACFISMSIGTSVGTVVALTPLVVELAQASGGNVPLYTAIVLGGAFFGDNLSFISDTTIAATRTQGCNMRDKFRANIWIALPAALTTLILYIIIGGNMPPATATTSVANPWLVIPYLVIIITAIIGINVVLVLIIGIICAIIIGIVTAQASLLQACAMMGEGIDSMGQLIIITMIAAGMLGLVKASGGITFLLQTLTGHVSGKHGAQWCIALVVSLVNMCTANNTVAIITVGSLSHDIAQRYGIAPRQAASLLDTCSCIVQCLIPYGAQTLLATGLAHISPAAPWPYLYYPWALAAMVMLSIIFSHRKSQSAT